MKHRNEFILCKNVQLSLSYTLYTSAQYSVSNISMTTLAFSEYERSGDTRRVTSQTCRTRKSRITGIILQTCSRIIRCRRRCASKQSRHRQSFAQQSVVDESTNQCSARALVSC